MPATDQEPRRVATIKLKKSYIIWKHDLDGKLRNQIDFYAALPALDPITASPLINKNCPSNGQFLLEVNTQNIHLNNN